MCGIVGYIGHQEAQPILLDGLKKLEYRGYDSAGIAVMTKQGLDVRKKSGKLAVLQEMLTDQPLQGTVGIGHTRWATHGKPSDVNSHPHVDGAKKFAIVHNGIIENDVALRTELEQKGHTFVSETDTEVIAHLLADLYAGDLVAAMQRAVKKMRGAYALAVIAEDEPDRLVAVRLASPLIVGVGKGENFIASDIPAILAHTRDVHILNDGEMAVLSRSGIQLITLEGKEIEREAVHIDWDTVTAEKSGYDHFMLKEIEEQPKAYRDTMSGRLDRIGKVVKLDELGMTRQMLSKLGRIHIVACGTAYHAGLVGKHVLEKLTRIPVETDVASEYRYRDPIITPNTLVIVVSQSGETADTLAALREAKRQGATVLAITNVIGSSVAREADLVLQTWAGPEIAVASTKAYTSQLIAFYLLSIYFAQMLKSYDATKLAELTAALQKLPEQVEHLIAKGSSYKLLAERIAKVDSMFFIGRSLDYAVALEGSLKLKEISYIHSEAYPAGELKHGTLALIEEGVPVVALATQTDVLDKTMSNIQEVAARGAHVIGVGMEGASSSQPMEITIPQTDPLLTPALSIVPLQLLAYYTALARGNDVDQPRNLAKSVTVE